MESKQGGEVSQGCALISGDAFGGHKDSMVTLATAVQKASLHLVLTSQDDRWHERLVDRLGAYYGSHGFGGHGGTPTLERMGHAGLWHLRQSWLVLEP